MVDLFDQITEESVLGALLVDTNAISLIANRLKISDFSRPKHQWIYEACLNLYNNNEVVEQYSVTHELARMERLEPMGGANVLSGLIANCPTSVFIESHTDMLIKYGARRSLSTAGYLISKLSEIDDVDKAYGDALGILIDIKTHSKKDVLMSPKDQADFADLRYAEKKILKNKSLIPFGFASIDNKIGGMDRGDVVVIAGPPAEGKTSLTHQIGLYVSAVYGEVLFVSLEMSKEQITDRDTARITKEPIRNIRKGEYDPELYAKIVDAIGIMSEGAMHYYYPSTGTTQQIYSMSRRMQLEHNLSLVVIDYIQLMNDSEGSRNENERLTNISRGIKMMAHELNVPVIVVSRINRIQGASTLDRTYGSGALSYDPDWSFLVEREKDVNGDYSNFCNLIITKMRQGGLKDYKLRLYYDEKIQKFTEV
jgi:replicative DNA helicase